MGKTVRGSRSSAPDLQKTLSLTLTMTETQWGLGPRSCNGNQPSWISHSLYSVYPVDRFVRVEARLAYACSQNEFHSPTLLAMSRWVWIAEVQNRCCRIDLSQLHDKQWFLWLFLLNFCDNFSNYIVVAFHSILFLIYNVQSLMYVLEDFYYIILLLS